MSSPLASSHPENEQPRPRQVVEAAFEYLRSTEPEAVPRNCLAASAQEAEIRRLRAKLQQCLLDFRVLIELYRIRNEPLPFVLRHAEYMDHLVED